MRYTVVIDSCETHSRLMTFRQFLAFMALATLAAWVGWLLVIWSTDPTRAGATGFLLFYFTLALSLVGTLTLAGTGIRAWIRRDELLSRHVAHAFRQAFLFACLVAGSLLLMSHDLLRWWTATLLIAFLSLVELVFLSATRTRRTGGF